MLGEETVRFILLDNDLDGQWGWQLVQRLKDSILFEEVPIIVCTGVSDKKSIIHYIHLKVKHFILKPYDVEKIGEVI